MYLLIEIFKKYIEIPSRDVFNKNSNNANWIKNEPVEMVDGNIDLALGLGELAQLTVNNESENNADVRLIKSIYLLGPNF